MSETTSRGLLPPGMLDGLPPQAGFEADSVTRLLRSFRMAGYEQIKPPLLEFEESLLGGAGVAMTQQTFRLMDPVSHAMLGLRADMTLQAARIATTRLAHEARPLRLCYAGQVLQVSGTQMRPERQVGQAGVELIGSLSPRADAEVILLACEALSDLGIADLSIDLNIPSLVPMMMAEMGMEEEEAEHVRACLDRKDASALSARGGKAAEAFLPLLRACGPAALSLSALEALPLPAEGREACARLAEVVGMVSQEAPEVQLTIDPVENRGFEYHCGVTFVFFARAVRGEIGRGGRYLAGGGAHGTTAAGNGSAIGIVDGRGKGEPATGFTLFMDTILPALPEPPLPLRLYLPAGTGMAQRLALKKEGWIVIPALEDDGDDAAIRAEARRLKCSHVLSGGVPDALNER